MLYNIQKFITFQNQVAWLEMKESAMRKCRLRRDRARDGLLSTWLEICDGFVGCH